MTSVLAVDVGTSAVKAARVVDGRVVEVASAGLAINTAHPGWAEQSPDDWWTAVREAVGSLRTAGADLSAVDAVAVTGQMQDLVAVDAAGRAVRPAILYSDARAAAEHAELAAELGDDWAAAIGAEPDATNLAAKWRWLARHDPASVARTDIVLTGAHSSIVHRLTGVATTDPTTAATTGLYDVESGAWWPPAVAASGIRLPPVHSPAAVVGRALDGPAGELGIVGGTPVVHASGDAVATTIGIVGDRLGQPHAYLGTSGWVAVASAQRSPATGAIVLPGLGAEHWITVAPMPTAGAAIDWARSELLGGVDHDAFEQLAGSACALAEGVIFVPHLDGARSPCAAPTATGALVGVRRGTTRRVIAAAVLEGVAHAVRALVDVVAAAAPELVVCGGAARAKALRRTLADVTGSAVRWTDDDHAALVGATVAAHVAIAAEPFEVGVGAEVIEPDRRRNALHRRSTSTFDAALPTMLPLMTSLAGVAHAEAAGGEITT